MTQDLHVIEKLVLEYNKKYGENEMLVLKKELKPVDIKNKPYYKYVPKRIGTHEQKIQALFKTFFDKPGNAEKFEKVKNAFLKNLQKGDSINPIITFSNLHSTQTILKLIKNYTEKDENDFVYFILRRALFMYFIFCKNKDIDDVRSVLGGHKGADPESKHLYLYQSMLINLTDSLPLGRFVKYVRRIILCQDHDLARNELDIIENFIESLSEFEIEIIRTFQ